MEQILPLDLPIHLSEYSGMIGERFGFGHRQEAVLIDGVLMILVELHQAPYTREGRDEFFQQMRPMHGFQGPRRAWARQNRKEGLACLRRVELFDGQRLRMPVNVFQERRIDTQLPRTSQVEERKQQCRLHQDL